jgi:tellurite resistance protein
MSRIQTPADACAALAVLVVGADELGTMAEGRFLFDTIAHLPVFEGMDTAGFGALVAETAEWVWSSYATDDNRISDAGLDELLDMICGALPHDIRAETLRAAVGLAKADGMVEPEKMLLKRLCAGLDVDPTGFLA